MKNLINRALVAEKRLFFLFAAAMMAVSAMAQDVAEPQKRSSSTQLMRVDNTYYYGGQAIDKSQLLDWYAQQNCKAAYEQFVRGQKLATAGWVCLGIGAALDVSAVVCAGIHWYDVYSPKSSSAAPARVKGYSTDALYFSAQCLSLGAAAFEIACIPLLVVGYHKMHSSADLYNVYCTTAQARPYWTLQASNNGLGLAMKF